MIAIFRAGVLLAFLSITLCATAVAADMSSAATLPKPQPGGAPWTQSQTRDLRKAIYKLLGAPTLRGAQIGLIAIDATRHSVLFSLNADQEFMPASNFKLLVGSASLARLGTAFTYTTTVLSDGSNVYLRGGGDALLSAKDLDDAAAAIAAHGVKQAAAVITDATHFDQQRYGYGWSWDDLPYYYAPVVSALELEDGVVHVYFSPGASAGSLANLRVTPQSTAFTIQNELMTGPAGSKDTSEIVRPWDAPRTILFTGNYPVTAKESGDVHPAAPDPPSYAGDVLMRALAAHGVTVTGALSSGQTPATATVLWQHQSEPMPQLLADFWYPSDNLMGEMFLKELGVVQAGAPGTDTNGATLEQNYLRSIGVDPATVTIADGSGLSQYDRITPRDLLSILAADWNGPNRDVVLDALPVAGIRGTLRTSYKGTPAEKNVFAKTGSISHVRTISGFVRTKTHGTVIFSFMINQWMGEDQKNGASDLAKLRGALLSQFVK